MSLNKVVSLKTALKAIPSGATTAITGFVSAGHPEYITENLEKQYLSEQTPKDLTLVYGAGQGDGMTKGCNHFGNEGMVKRVIGGHWGLAPRLGQLANDGKIEAYNLPQGVICKMFRESASKRKYLYSPVGLETFVDPRQGGGKVRADVATEDLVHLVKEDDDEILRFKVPEINVALVRATVGDRQGNLSIHKEPFNSDILHACMAAHNNGGIVIAQVEDVVDRIVPDGNRNPGEVVVPAHLVDYIVQAPEEYCGMSYNTHYNPAFISAEWNDEVEFSSEIPLVRRLIAARAAQYLKPGQVINLGIGLPEAVALVASENGIMDSLTSTVEVGTNGGVAASGNDFGAMYYPTSILAQNNQFDFYHGAGLDITFLGLAELDSHGNVNVSNFNGRLTGCGGFIDISQTTEDVVFMGTFTAGGLDIDYSPNTGLKILKEGKHSKFCQNVEEITFSAKRARDTKQNVSYITERCVFKMDKNKGFVLAEVPEGIDVQKDVIEKMPFEARFADDFAVNPDFFNPLAKPMH
eukprot:TRINITY_DN141_c0_g3_i1.p1 TRINITY_DN141_c0_g3~~TRINITY_DN141_c0_g3_i1.p1  ORF type:complete len:523 (-),score=205.43 TRINITY_DN141_c0_g3_i1:1623-3191(-)